MTTKFPKPVIDFLGTPSIARSANIAPVLVADGGIDIERVRDDNPNRILFFDEFTVYPSDVQRAKQTLDAATK